MRPHQCRVEDNDHLSGPAGHTLLSSRSKNPSPQVTPRISAAPLPSGSDPTVTTARSTFGAPPQGSPQYPNFRAGEAPRPRLSPTAGGRRSPSPDLAEDRAGQVNGPGRAAEPGRSPSPGPARAARARSQSAGRGGAAARASEQRERLRRAEAGAACPAQTPPPAFLRPLPPPSLPPSLRGSPGDAERRRRARGLDRTGARPLPAPLAPPGRGLDVAGRPAGAAAARWRVGIPPSPFPHTPPPRRGASPPSSIPPPSPLPRPGFGSAARRCPGSERGGLRGGSRRGRASRGRGRVTRGTGARRARWHMVRVCVCLPHRRSVAAPGGPAGGDRRM